jgi:beta-lactamase class A
MKPKNILLFIYAILSFASVGQAMPIKEQLAPKELEQSLTQLIKGYPGRVGLYMHDLKTDQVITINADEPFLMASTYKVPIMIQLFRDHDAKKLSLQQKVTLTRKIMIPGFLENMSPGTQLNLHDLALFMVTLSDNTASDIILEKVQQKNINATLHQFQIAPMNVSRPVMELIADFKKHAPFNLPLDDKRDTTTARAMGHLLDKLSRCELSSLDSCESMKHILSKTQNYARMPRKLSHLKNVTFYHKTGTTDWYTHDVGFIKINDQPDIILCLYTQKDTSSQPMYVAEELMGNLSEKIVNHYMSATIH